MAKSKKDLFFQIWKVRPHYCAVCKKPINPPRAINFAHILSIKQYPKFEYLEENIEILCDTCHYNFDHDTHRAVGDPKFDPLYRKQESLKIKYRNVL